VCLVLLPNVEVAPRGQLAQYGVVGAWVDVRCPVGGCDYKASMRLGAGARADASAYAERVTIVRDEHPAHPVDNLLLVAGDEPGRS
jgi:hypothetical protein